MIKIFNKLVRDNIPDIIVNNGEHVEIETLDDAQYKTSLYKKLQEECSEAILAVTPTETIEELADIMEVIDAIAGLYDSSLEQVLKIKQNKKDKKGGFEKRIFLKKTY